MQLFKQTELHQCSFIPIRRLEQLLSARVAILYQAGGKISPWAACSPKLSITPKGQAISCIRILKKKWNCVKYPRVTAYSLVSKDTCCRIKS